MDHRSGWLVGTLIAAASIAHGCGHETGGVAGAGGSGGATAGASGTAATGGSAATSGFGGLLDGGGPTALAIEPTSPTVTVVNGAAQTIQFVAKSGTQPVSALWSLNRAEIGTIGASTGLFATGFAAGAATVTAVVGTETLSTTVTVYFETEQNGAPPTGTCPPGGCGGVGGEGAGPAVDAAIRAVLDGVPAGTGSLAWLYPYDRTVWPLGILAPLLQWSDGTGAPIDGVKIELDSQHYTYTGYFGRPAALAAGAPFVRHPIPQDVWDAATHSAAGSTLRARVTVSAGGAAYGPIEENWRIASAALKGTVYYQSYGTKLAKNYNGSIGGDGRFGGATLAIRGSSTEPVLVAGTDGGSAQCRVCHSVSADGSRMIAQHGDDYQVGSSYALTAPGYPESPYGPAGTGTVGWMGLFPDGSIGLGNSGPLPGGANGNSSSLLDATSGAPIASNGFSNLVTRAGTPAFSPDGKKVAFVFYAGPGDAVIGPGSPSKLVVMDFDRATSTFSNPRLIFQGTGSQRPGWPAFLPTNDRLVFQVELQANSQNEYLATRNGARAELWWADLATGQTYPLGNANGDQNGVSYLPTGPNNHGNDTEVNYEPTVNPIVSGGFAWVVFTSRRLYGNVATIDPWWSDPRAHDLTTTPTPKKLWVAAIDIPALGGENPQATDDPSYPAFYLPAQELLAGNTRGFWVPDPCKPTGSDCVSGDECCGGFCTYDAQLMKSVCGDVPDECSQEFDKCSTDSDCCDAEVTGVVCINQRCARPGPK